MNPSLIPDLAQLTALIGSVIVALLCIGVGVWTGARRAETALIAGWGVAGFATVVAGTLTSIGLSVVMMVLAVAGALGLVRAGMRSRSERADFQFGPLLRVAVLALPFAAGIAGVETVGWDDFTHWLPNLAYLCVHDHFPSLAHPSGSYHAGYPYGIGLPGFGIFLVTGRVPETATIFWNLIVMLCAAACVAGMIGQRLPDVWSSRSRSLDWISAAIGLLVAGMACPTFVPKIFLSNMADAATGSVLAVLLSILAEETGARDGRIGRALAFAFGCVALLNLRQANGALFGLLLIGAGLAVWRHRRESKPAQLWPFGLTLVLPVGVLILWGHYASAQIPGGEFIIMPFSEWRWGLLPTTLVSIGRVMLSKVGLFALIAYLAISAGLAWRGASTATRTASAVVIVAATVSVGMMGFLAFTYLAANFNDQEAAAAASFWRYMSEVGPVAVFAAAAIVPLGWLRVVSPARAALVLVCFTLVLPLATIPFYRADLTSDVPRLRQTIAAVGAAVPGTAPLTLIDVTGNGFPVVAAYYDLALSQRALSQSPRAVTSITNPNGVPVTEISDHHFNDGSYVWLAQGVPALDGMFSASLDRNESYLWRRQGDHFDLVGQWPISSRPPIR